MYKWILVCTINIYIYLYTYMYVYIYIYLFIHLFYFKCIYIYYTWILCKTVYNSIRQMWITSSGTKSPKRHFCQGHQVVLLMHG